MGEDAKDKEIKFASTEKIERYDHLLDDFLENVVEVEGAWVSDESSLWDFTTPYNEEGEYDEREGGKDYARYLWRIRKEYGVDVSDIEDGNLVRIFERIYG